MFTQTVSRLFSPNPNPNPNFRSYTTSFRESSDTPYVKRRKTEEYLLSSPPAGIIDNHVPYSLIDTFTFDEIRKHNYSLWRWGQNNDNQIINLECEKHCQLCEVQNELTLSGRAGRVEEHWVKCCRCEAWQHQICALFNAKMNGDDAQHKYVCPICYMHDIRSGRRNPLPKSSVLGAKDLPKTILSDYIENRLFKRLKEERLERSQLLEIDDVQGVEGLVVRVVSSVQKTLKVEKPFLDVFRHENYPPEFPYQSKVILLFQNIDGADVCIFGMMVQEFGSDCLPPNQRCVYLSYLDSVKYFTPDIKTASGEFLRTFVYHEVLIGYLEYCKTRGFTSCYLYSAPPVDGDYLFHCHPKSQKTPKSVKLRKWYLSMVEKAMEEDIVVSHNNIYDYFFVPHGECKAKVTAARLPYCEGDYISSTLDDFAEQKIPENVCKASDVTERTGRLISLEKKNLLLLHLQSSCRHCCDHIISGNCWVCNKCNDFQICDKCYKEEKTLPEKDRHPINQAEKHVLKPVQIREIPADTKDQDEVINSTIFDSRLEFLNLCRDNNYQFDTLRRAKHSSMMVLYHLHISRAPVFAPT